MRPLLLLALAGAAVAAETEVLREEAYNYRIVGALPRGWKRQGSRRAFTFSIDKIPHAHVHFTRQRVRGQLDARKELERRGPRYHFPGVAKDAKGTITATRWGGHDALQYEFKATVQDVACTRRVWVLFTGGIWYELIETVYGAGTESNDACRVGLEVFRSGFSLLVAPLPDGTELDTEERTIRSEVYGYTIVKPRQFVRRPVNTGIDPGARVQFERVAKNGKQHARVRLFEYAARQAMQPREWFDIFYTSFAAHHAGPTRKETKPPVVPGAREVWAETFAGERDKLPVKTLILIVHAESGRVLVLRIRTQADADKAFKQGLDRVLATFRAAG